MSTPQASASKFRIFEPPNRYGWGFGETKGTLTFFSRRAVRTYRASPPASWYRTRDYPNWRGDFGAEDFQTGYLGDVRKRCRIYFEMDLKAGFRVPRPGLFSMARFHDLLDPEAVQLTATLRSDSWRLYCLLARAPLVRDIARDNLGLAMLIAQARISERWRFRGVARLARRKRVEIAAACGLPAQKQWVKLLTRTDDDSLSFHCVQQLRAIARYTPDAIEQLRHLPRVTGGVLGLVTPELFPHVQPSLLHEVAADPLQRERVRYHRGRTEGTLNDTLHMLAALGEPIPVFRSVAQLDQLHDEVAERVWARQPDRTRPFALPPLPETDAIIGLRSPLELRAEAKQQRNCLAAGYWADDCYDGDLYIYRITAPERASVAIRRDIRGDWRIVEFKTRFNDDPSRATVRAVHGWLRAGNEALARGWRPGEMLAPPHTDADFLIAADLMSPDVADRERWQMNELRGEL